MGLLSVVILAAGKGTRMHSAVPKPLCCLGGKPLLAHVLDQVTPLNPQQLFVVAGNNQEALAARFAQPNLEFVHQAKQLGTADALKSALPKIPPAHRVLVLLADMPLLQQSTLKKLIEITPKTGLGLISAKAPDPFGYGRILRNDAGEIIEIREEKELTDAQKKLDEIHAGVFCAPCFALKTWVADIHPKNTQQEYYLTDIVAFASKQPGGVENVFLDSPTEILGVNTQKDLMQLERLYQKQQAEQFLEAGLQLKDANRVDFRNLNLHFGSEVVLDVNVILEGNITLGQSVKIGPNCMLKNTVLGDNVVVLPNTVIEGAVVESNTRLGPFAHIRPNTHLRANSKIGNFVETKNITLGPHSKAGHLSYLGDATIGARVNIGAGTITCNYDGVNKHQTIIEDNVFIGSDTQLIAPVCVKTGATIGAGTTVMKEAPAHKLTINEKKQCVLEHWVRPENTEVAGE